MHYINVCLYPGLQWRRTLCRGPTSFENLRWNCFILITQSIGVDIKILGPLEIFFARIHFRTSSPLPVCLNYTNECKRNHTKHILNFLKQNYSLM